MNQLPTCRDCKEPMEPGFQLDNAHAAILQAQWVPGDPTKRRWFTAVEATNQQRAAALRIITFRCPNCGLLDSYAIDPVKPA